MKREYDFSNAVRGKFYRPRAALRHPIYLDAKVQVQLERIAKKKGKLEIQKLPASNLEHLKEAALLKKKRAVDEIVRRSGDKNNLLYLNLSQRLTEKLLAQ